ncbi:hypothetical protein PR048_024031 [Dryococelus australis]|uniref:Uncharacterized protein n=1 Tax=Dryococelus australis TaxID=614101 RepID=A0ABQ9GVS1_9NEOP|nr:hypothetical protein PR048_024031 [Dryococelus australis]
MPMLTVHWLSAVTVEGHYYPGDVKHRVDQWLEPDSIPGWLTPDFRKLESCRTIPLVGGVSRGCPVSPAPSFRRCSISTAITLIGSQDLAVAGFSFEEASARRPSGDSHRIRRFGRQRPLSYVFSGVQWALNTYCVLTSVPSLISTMNESYTTLVRRHATGKRKTIDNCAYVPLHINVQRLSLNCWRVKIFVSWIGPARFPDIKLTEQERDVEGETPGSTSPATSKDHAVGIAAPRGRYTSQVSTTRAHHGDMSVAATEGREGLHGRQSNTYSLKSLSPGADGCQISGGTTPRAYTGPNQVCFRKIRVLKAMPLSPLSLHTYPVFLPDDINQSAALVRCRSGHKLWHSVDNSLFAYEMANYKITNFSFLTRPEKRGSNKYDISTRIKCAIATKLKTLSWRVVSTLCFIYLQYATLSSDSEVSLVGGLCPRHRHFIHSPPKCHDVDALAPTASGVEFPLLRSAVVHPLSTTLELGFHPSPVSRLAWTSSYSSHLNRPGQKVILYCRFGKINVKKLARLPPRRTGIDPRPDHSRFSQVGIVPGRCVLFGGFSPGFSRFLRPLTPALFHTHLTSPSSALNTTMLRAAHISSLAQDSQRHERSTRSRTARGASAAPIEEDNFAHPSGPQGHCKRTARGLHGNNSFPGCCRVASQSI